MWIDVDDAPATPKIEGWKYESKQRETPVTIALGVGWGEDDIEIHDSYVNKPVTIHKDDIPKLIKALTLAAKHFNIPLDE